MLLILSVPFQRNDNLDCLENSYASIGRYYGRGYECALANSWSFRYERHPGQSIGECLQTENNFSFSMLEQYHGVRAHVHSCPINDAVTLLQEELRAGKPSVIELKSSCIPWDTNYTRHETPYEHAIIATGWDSLTQSFICTDSWYGCEREKISVKEWVGERIPVTTFMISGKEAVPDVRDLLNKSLNHFERGSGENHPFSAMKKLAEDIRSLDLKAEFNGYRPLLPPYGPPISNHLYTISNNRKKFSVYLGYLSEQEWHGRNALKEIASDFKVLAEKWKIITGVFYKAFFTGAEESGLLKRISLKVQETADLEERLYNLITGVLQYAPDVTRQKPQQRPTLNNCETFELAPWFNNTAFGSIIGGHQADFTGTGDFFLSEDIPGDRCIQAGVVEFLFPEADGFKPDNISCRGQMIPVHFEKPIVGFLSILGCGEWGCPFESLIVHYEDMDSEQISVKVTDWEATKPMFGESSIYSGRCAKNENGVIQPLNHKVFIYDYHFKLTKLKKIQYIELPDCSNLHLFALSAGY
ncbi:hypothetical protein P40081_27190 [Paenibacillus sp. FSL P4-0081]|uniref:hypothetical protein n=2 Tax=Paenibacillus TaxID=44249 RepID=UPI0004F5C158|nr:hypothetical protein [Paenibacillus sp. FSL P4-0081]AIQ31437.1 hypothetical protein P40081_27190 [Paenibacillus sp. FSL P4-0081]